MMDPATGEGLLFISAWSPGGDTDARIAMEPWSEAVRLWDKNKDGLLTLEEYRKFTHAVKSPLLANITEFGKTPLFTTRELKSAGVQLVLYPLSAFRAMNAAALALDAAVAGQGVVLAYSTIAAADLAVERIRPRMDLAQHVVHVLARPGMLVASRDRVLAERAARLAEGNVNVERRHRRAVQIRHVSTLAAHSA